MLWAKLRFFFDLHPAWRKITGYSILHRFIVVKLSDAVLIVPPNAVAVSQPNAVVLLWPNAVVCQKSGSSAKWIGNDGGFFIPFWIHLAPHHRSEGMTKAWRRQSVSAFDIMIPKKTTIRMPLCVKKSGRKWHMMTITIGINILHFSLTLWPSVVMIL